MRILFCSQSAPATHLGGPKVIAEIMGGLRELGHHCDFIGPDEVRAEGSADEVYWQNLRRYLIRHASEYDIVEYDHCYLPFPRSEFPAHTLFVARSVLLAHHLLQIELPHGRSLRAQARHALLGWRDRKRICDEVARAQITIEQADLVNVSNFADKDELVRCGIDSSKIAVLPFGLSRSRRLLFANISSDVPKSPIVCFIGSYDYRKGAVEQPEIIGRIKVQVANCRFRLLGTAGLFRTEREVRAFFPASLQDCIEVVPTFDPATLPQRLADCSVGIFPSHIEGFGFGVLEMLAASVPVVAYDAPGPPMMLPEPYLVPRGNAVEMAGRVSAMLRDTDSLKNARKWAKKRSQDFNWDEIGQSTADLYALTACEQKLK